jgi:N6-L-threonylcarbamoyladenine synthase
MNILSIETSCDDTGIALIEAKGSIKNPSFRILANELSSQIDIHKEYGGVFPALAKREHIKNLPIVFAKILKKAKIEKKKKPFDLITVTYGPGLEPALWTGIVFAKELSEKYSVPIIPVNHMEGHIFSVFGKQKGEFKIPKIDFPILSLLISGGHTELVLSKSLMEHKIIGQTLDDAVGEAFDKTARMLGLSYPGGPEISKLAERGRNIVLKSLGRSEISLPRPMMYSKNFDFSFSGLKTAVLYLIKKIEPLNETQKIQIALEFENAVTETLIHKTKKAIEKYGAKTLIIGGGVSANTHIRKEIKKNIKIKEIIFPDKKLSTDNAIMIGMVGYMRFLKNDKKGKKPSSIKAVGNLSF